MKVEAKFSKKNKAHYHYKRKQHDIDSAYYIYNTNNININNNNNKSKFDIQGGGIDTSDITKNNNKTNNDETRQERFNDGDDAQQPEVKDEYKDDEEPEEEEEEEVIIEDEFDEEDLFYKDYDENHMLSWQNALHNTSNVEASQQDIKLKNEKENVSALRRQMYTHFSTFEIVSPSPTQEDYYLM